LGLLLPTVCIVLRGMGILRSSQKVVINTAIE
jgi:hypothetical protein